MAALLAPFESPDENGTQSNDQTESSQPGTRTPVQDNLVTRNGEIERELDRMRLLLARVAGRVAQLPDKSAVASRGEDNDNTTDSMDIDSLERVKVETLLDNL